MDIQGKGENRARKTVRTKSLKFPRIRVAVLSIMTLLSVWPTGSAARGEDRDKSAPVQNPSGTPETQSETGIKTPGRDATDSPQWIYSSEEALHQLEMNLLGQKYYLAEFFAQRILAERPEDNRVRRIYADVLRKLGKFDPSIEQFDRLLKMDPDNLDLIVGRGRACAEKFANPPLVLECVRARPGNRETLPDNVTENPRVPSPIPEPQRDTAPGVQPVPREKQAEKVQTTTPPSPVDNSNTPSRPLPAPRKSPELCKAMMDLNRDDPKAMAFLRKTCGNHISP